VDEKRRIEFLNGLPRVPQRERDSDVALLFYELAER